jgi:hypothetical protein
LIKIPALYTAPLQRGAMSLEAAQLLLQLSGSVKDKRKSEAEKPDGAAPLKKRRSSIYPSTREPQRQQQQQQQAQQQPAWIAPPSTAVRVVSPSQQQPPTIEEVQTLCDRLKQKISTLSAEEMSAFVRGDVTAGTQTPLTLYVSLH